MAESAENRRPLLVKKEWSSAQKKTDLNNYSMPASLSHDQSVTAASAEINFHFIIQWQIVTNPTIQLYFIE